VLAWFGMRRARAASDDAWALSLNAFAALLISPISWSHHWVWAAPALLLLAVRGLQDKNRALLAAALTGLAVFAAGPQWWFPHTENREAHWAAWEQVIGGSYVILAAVILLISAHRNDANKTLGTRGEPRSSRAIALGACEGLPGQLAPRAPP